MIIRVGMADLKMAEAPAVLQTTLGSCIGIAIYEQPPGKTGGLAHIMLPVNNNGDPNTAKYADTAIAELIRKMTSRGISRSSLAAKIAGGAKMFDTGKKINYLLEIGLKNAEAVRERLNMEGIRLTAADTGRNYGRNVQFDIATGRMTIQSHGRETIVI
ncbi:MAG: chemotaxis protein CheD [Nitrospinae bacterium]|nr:chemotaxis protein CheD [Nitrospinota bacterium]